MAPPLIVIEDFHVHWKQAARRVNSSGDLPLGGMIVGGKCQTSITAAQTDAGHVGKRSHNRTGQILHMRSIVILDCGRELNRQRLGNFELAVGALIGVVGKKTNAVADAQRKEQ